MAPRLRLAMALMTAVVAWGLLPEAAAAVTVTSSKTVHLSAADLQVELASTDPTCSVVLLVDGTVVGLRPALPGERLDFGAIRLPAGSHTAAALLRSRSGAPVRSRSIGFHVWTPPTKAKLVTPAPGGYGARYVAGSIKTGFQTTAVHIYVNGRLFRKMSVRENALVSIGKLELAAGVNTIKLVAINPVSQTTASYKVTRLDFPWATCIVIDKSDFRLYWVRNGVLVKAYPIAIGKPGTATPVGTWKVGMKHVTSWGSVYGPRKLRLYRKTASGFVYTAYAVHGTNQEWVIGTMASHGCIRMYNRDVMELYPQVPIGTMVQTRQ
ncbi:MAG: L,D-transpeptidase [Coriobacteriia bacterium]